VALRQQGLRPRQIAVLGAIVAAIVVAGLVRWSMTPEVRYAPSRSEVGEPCTRNVDCWSECLPRDEASSAGVCTQYCAMDSECPSSMRCDDVYMVNALVGTRTRARR